MTKRPSFVLYITDQHRADFLGCYGHPILKTPNIDKLAAQGVAHDRFYVASPVCMPNRASLMTCRMPSSHGLRMNGLPLASQHVTFVEQLREAGYDTALIGKSHLQPWSGQKPLLTVPDTRDGYHKSAGDVSQALRHDVKTENYRTESPAYWQEEDAAVPTPYYGFDHVELVTGHGDGCGGDYGRWLRRHRPDADTLMGAKNQLPHDYVCPQAVRTAIPEELYSTTYVAERAEAWLEGRKDNDRPFFLMVSWPDPHHPFNPPGKYWDMYDPDDFPVPEAFGAADWVSPVHVANVHAARDSGAANMVGMESIGCTPREAQEAQALTCGMITMVDDGVGRVQKALAAAGKSDDTVTMFTTDHGDHLGDHRMLFKFAEQYEQLTRVPFIWSDPDGESGVRTDAIGQTLDIGTTILERARIEPATGMHGGDLTTCERDHAYIQYAAQANIAGLDERPNVFTIRDKQYRLSMFLGLDWGELYDLEADPGELNNLWDDPDHALERADLVERLARSAFATIDSVPMPLAKA